jgi:hypothetical protein
VCERSKNFRKDTIIDKLWYLLWEVIEKIRDELDALKDHWVYHLSQDGLRHCAIGIKDILDHVMLNQVAVQDFP